MTVKLKKGKTTKTITGKLGGVVTVTLPQPRAGHLEGHDLVAG